MRTLTASLAVLLLACVLPAQQPRPKNPPFGFFLKITDDTITFQNNQYGRGGITRKLAKGCKLTIDGKEAKPDDFVRDMNLKFEYEGDAIKAVMGQTPARPREVKPDRTNEVIRGTLSNKQDTKLGVRYLKKPEDGLKLDVDPERCYCSIDGKPCKYADLKEDMKCVVYGTTSKAVTIDCYVKDPLPPPMVKK